MEAGLHRRRCEVCFGAAEGEKFAPRSGAPLHLFIFYGFLTLFIATTILAINKYSPWKFHQGGFYLTYEFVVDWMGLVFVVGVLWALGRRVFSRPRTMCSAPADYWALGLLLALGITGFLVEAMRMSANPQSFDNSAPIGFWLSQQLGGMEANSFVAVWWVHVLLVCAFFVSLPQMRLRHILYAVSTASGSNPDLGMGSLALFRLKMSSRRDRLAFKTLATTHVGI